METLRKVLSFMDSERAMQNLTWSVIFCLSIGSDCKIEKKIKKEFMGALVAHLINCILNIYLNWVILEAAVLIQPEAAASFLFFGFSPSTDYSD